MGVTAVAQDCCQLVLLSNTEPQGIDFDLNTAAVHFRFVIAPL